MKKVALVTGGTRGIGSAICQKLLQENYFVIAADIDAEQSQEWLKSQQENYKDVDIAICNVADFDSCTKMVADIQAKHKTIDVLVNNAGITRDGTLKKMPKENWDAVIKVDLDSIFNVTRNVINLMLDNGFGRIINISSVNGQKGQFGQTNYAAAKAGILGFTKSLALEVAKKNITVNAIAPGYINTEMMQGIPEDILKGIVAQIPVGRLGEPKEIARLVTFLAAEESGFITGSTFIINGGLYM